MTGFSVNSGSLDDFGQSWHDWGSNEVTRLSAYTTTYAGQTDGMTGLLAVLSPAVKELASLYADHYTKLATVVAGTGSGLITTAQSYQAADKKSAAKLDATMPGAGTQTDVPADGNASISGVYEAYPATAPQSDPAQPIRDDMSFDVKAIDWLFEKATGHHITEPIDYMVGNWTTLTAQGDAWGHLSESLTDYGTTVIENTDAIDHIWDGVAASTFKEYGHRLGDGLKGEAQVCYAIQQVLKKIASEFEECFKQAVDLLQSVIHQVEAAAAWLAALWWCGVGEVEAAEKAGEASYDFYQAYKLAHRIELAIKVVNGAVEGFQKLKDIWNVVSNAPAEISAKIDELKGLIQQVGAVPGRLDDLSNLPATPPRATEAPVTPVSEPGAGVAPPVELRPPGFDQLPPDIRAQLELVLAPVERMAADLDRMRAENAAHLEAEQARGFDPEIERALTQAAKNPDAPASLKRVAHEVSLGKLGWGDVFGAGARTDDPHIADVRRDTFDTAREHFDNDDWKVEIVAVDPDGPPPRRGTWLE